MNNNNDFTAMFGDMARGINYHALLILMITFFIMGSSLFVENVMSQVPDATDGKEITTYGLIVETVIFALIYILAHIFLGAQ